MKIKISNLGPIHDEAQFDLKPLTIFIGPNNSGKTWLAYTLAAIFSPYGYKFYTDNEHIEDIPQNYPPLIQVTDKILQEGKAKLNLWQFADEYGERYFNNIALQASTWLPKFMSTNNISFNKMKCLISITEEKQKFLKHVQDASIHMGIGISKQKILINIRKKKGQKDLYLYTSSEDLEQEELPREILEEVLTKEVLRVFHYALYPNVVFFPTERTTYITVPFSAFSYRSQQKNILSERFESEDEFAKVRPVPAPVGYCMNFINKALQVDTEKKLEREKKAQTSLQVAEYIKLADILEKSILGGTIDFSVSDPAPTREIEFHPANSSQSIEIPITSSMVKELAPLVFYLRYFAQTGELLIIDEPEMNLHPIAQVKILEFLAMLVNAGLNVLITTHSPYMTDHLLNLTKAKQHLQPELIVSNFFLQDQKAFIEEKDVSLYLIDQGKIIDAADEDADWNTFGKVSDRISDIYFSL
jgi:AAA15 family ATPase/GTPase